MFQRSFDAGLAQASYLLACDRTRDAVVIDPRRDVDIYAAAAAQSQLRIIAAIETHIHADFVSGARELAAAGATIFAGPGSSLKFPAREVVDNERFVVGDLILRLLHTPGHTPEHISILAEHPAEPTRVFTGDTLFVGAVGRPDLLGEAMMRRLWRDVRSGCPGERAHRIGSSMVLGPNVILVGGQTRRTARSPGAARANVAPQAPFFQLGLVGATVPALKIDGEIGQQLGYLNANTIGIVNFVILLIVGWAFAHNSRYEPCASGSWLGGGAAARRSP